ncbi:MAG: MFS transporter [Clostridia bacterium]|nr:MFS transporter [Clostridia bacterium]
MYKNTANKKIGLMLFALCFAAYTASYVGRLNFSAALAGMTSSGVLDKVQGGTIATLYYFCYAAGQLFSGWLGDRISPFVQVSIGVAGAALCNIGMAIVGDASAMTVIWGANGIFQSMLWAPTLVIISRIMPKDMCDKACVGMSLCSPLGILAAYIMSSLVLREGSYHGIFVGAGALLAVVFFLCILGWCHILPRLEREESASIRAEGGTNKGLLPLLASAGVFSFVIPVALHGALKDGVATWVPTMMGEMYALSPAYSTFITMFLPIINLSGAWIAMRMRDRTGSELQATTVLFVVSGIFVLPLLIGTALPPMIAVLLLSVITTLMYAVNYFFVTLIPVKFASLGCVSVVTGMLNYTTYIGSSLSGYGYGAISEYLGWDFIVYIWIGITVIGALLCLASSKRWKKFKAEHEIE